MKKLFFYFVTIGVLFSACQKDNSKFGYNPEKESVKKLPSKEYGGMFSRTFQYDNLNRLIAVIAENGHRYDIWYNDDHTPSRVRSTYGHNNTATSIDTLVYKGNQVFIFKPNLNPPYVNDTTIITLNSKGEIVESKIGAWYFEGHRYHVNFIYNSNGNVSRWINSDGEASTTILYTTIPSMFRHVNTPDWFIFYYYLDWSGDFLYSKKGYMPATGGRWGYDNRFTYEVDNDGYGYVTRINGKTYQYILAR